MPELPEVEVIRRRLAAALPGLVISSVEVLEQRSFPGYSDSLAQRLIGSQVVDVGRRGKLLLIFLRQADSTEIVLMAHLRMTGQLVFRSCKVVDLALAGGYANRSLIGDLPDKSTRVVFGFSDGSQLFFNDQRKFGYFKLVDACDLDADDFLSRLGPEPLADGFDWKALRLTLGGGTGSIKAALLDQNKLAGIGNIYADESLFHAGIDPRRTVASLKLADYKRLCTAICDCLNQSITDGGSTARNYVDALGLRGEYLDLHACVYGREGQPCPRCGRSIVKIRVAGRGTHVCEKCQR